MTTATLPDLAELEQLIARSLGTEGFYGAGAALRTIRDEKLYQATHRQFAAYVRDRWEMKERAAYQLITAAAVIDTLRNCAYGTLPATESQARPLTVKTLTPDQVCELWAIVLETAPDGRITARHVKETVGAYLGNEPREQAEKPKQPEPEREDRRVSALRTAASALYDLYQALLPGMSAYGGGILRPGEDPPAPKIVHEDAASWAAWWRDQLAEVQTIAGPHFGYAQYHFQFDPDPPALRLQVGYEDSVLVELRTSLDAERAAQRTREAVAS